MQLVDSRLNSIHESAELYAADVITAKFHLWFVVVRTSVWVDAVTRGYFLQVDSKQEG